MLPTKFRNHLAKWFQRRRFLEINQSETRIACGGHVCKWIGTKWALFIEDAHRCFLPSFGSFGQAVSEEKNFKNQPIRNKSHLWWPCLLTDRDEMSILYRGPSIDAAYQVLVHLAKRFQMRRFKKICIEKTAFWIQISIFKQELSFFNREDILEINQSETRIACGGHVC
jgi:hypothetical protein